jgi:hypothetical protein
MGPKRHKLSDWKYLPFTKHVSKELEFDLDIYVSFMSSLHLSEMKGKMYRVITEARDD